MASLSNIIKVTKSQYDTLVGGGTITKDGVSYSYDQNTLYLVESGNYVENSSGNNDNIVIEANNEIDIYAQAGDGGFMTDNQVVQVYQDSEVGSITVRNYPLESIEDEYAEYLEAGSVSVVADGKLFLTSMNGNTTISSGGDIVFLNIPTIYESGQHLDFLTVPSSGRKSWAGSVSATSTSDITVVNCTKRSNPSTNLYAFVFAPPAHSDATINIDIGPNFSGKYEIYVIVSIDTVVRFSGGGYGTATKKIMFLNGKTITTTLGSAPTFANYVMVNSSGTNDNLGIFNPQPDSRLKVSINKTYYAGFYKNYTASTVYAYEHTVSLDITGSTMVCNLMGEL